MLETDSSFVLVQHRVSSLAMANRKVGHMRDAIISVVFSDCKLTKRHVVR